MTVDRCVCHRVLFRYMIELSRKTGQDFDTIVRTTGIGSRCGMCIPYAKIALETRMPRVPVMPNAAREELRRA